MEYNWDVASAIAGYFRRTLCLMLVLACWAAVPVRAQVTLPDTQLLTNQPGTEEQRSQPFGTWLFDLAPDGYVEEEFLVSGTANIYEYIDDAGQNPGVQVRTPDVPYVTRILVRRPIDPNDFNGTVYVEALNPTFGYDVDFIWQFSYGAIIDEGAVWVGVTSKPIAADFLRDGWGTSLHGNPLPPRNNGRYKPISMPAFSQVWDILSQVGMLLKTDADPDNPLAGFGVQRNILSGYSQSSGYVITYANSFHTVAPVYDGYFSATGSFAAKRVRPPEIAVAGDARNVFSVSAPSFRFQTETEVLPFFSAETVRQTEPADPLVRTYEIAGGSHLDPDSDAIGGQITLRDIGDDSWHGDCELPLTPDPYRACAFGPATGA